MGDLPHAQPSGTVVGALGSGDDGLRSEEATRRLAAHGRNDLPSIRAISPFRILVAQFRGVIPYLLIAAVGLSIAFGDRLEAVAIAAALLVNSGIGFTTEYRARRAMDALTKLEAPRATVVRDGRVQAIDARDLVPGDVIEVEPGSRVPADARLLRVADLRSDEAPLTGESMPVEKQPEASLAPDTPLAERTTMIYLGTTIVGGIGRAVVTATGVSTELGGIGKLVAGVVVEPTPLERRLDALGRRLVWITLGVAAGVAGLGLWNRLPLDDVITTSIALAIAAVPEALPAVATIALAVGMHRMARRHAVVRRLPAVESLGSTTVICTDKTRTLTSGEMAVVRVHAGGRVHALGETQPQDAAVAALLEAAVLASRAQAEAPDDEQVRVDPVDRAIADAAGRAGIDRDALVQRAPFVELLPFSSERKLMASFHKMDGRLFAFVKGAPGPVFAICDSPADGHDANEVLAGDGLRVLAVASGPVNGTGAANLQKLSLLGLVGLADPPAAGVKETIAALRGANLRTVMLTGDQRLTAQAVGRELGVIDEADQAIDGRRLDELLGQGPDAIRTAVREHAVFSRVTPEHKLRIIEALQHNGEIVAMLGDGVNDAAALKRADIGVAMGQRGTDAAKQAAAIILQDDRFDTIAAAVEEGRVIFDNIRKFVFFLFSCNVAEILLLLIAGVAGLPLPLLPLQLLWLNIVTDTFPALALALEPAESDVMRRPPRRPDEAILSRGFLGAVLIYSLLITASSLTAFLWSLATEPRQATTMAFMTLAFAQIAHLGNARRIGAVHSGQVFANRYAIGGAALGVGLQLLAGLWAPLAHLLRLEPLGPYNWAIVVGLGLFPAVAGQLIKRMRS